MATNKYHTLLRTIQRAAALLCAGMLAFSISSFREFSALADSEETERASEDRFTASLMDREHTYASYPSQIGPQPDGTEEISLDVSAFRAEGIEPAEYEGTEALLFPGEGESAEAVVTVKKAGVYEIALQYYPVPGSSREIEIGLELDDAFPFSEAAAIVLERVWRDETEIQTDPTTGNQYSPRQIECPMWLTSLLKNRDGKYQGAYRLYLTEGEHTLRLTALQTAFAFGGCTLSPPNEPPAYADYIKTHGKPADGEYRQTYEAERASLKSDQTLSPSGDRTSPNTSPYDVAKIRMNVIGRNWNSPAQWIEWEFSVPAGGYYRFHFRYQQDGVKGLAAHRILTIDGETPFREAETLRFPYTEGWASAGLQDGEGQDAAVWLEAGSHTLRLEATSGGLTESIRSLDNVVYNLNELYRQIIMITGVSPDKYQDYALEASVPGLLDTLAAAASSLREAYADVSDLSGGKGNYAELLSRFAYQLEDFVKESDTIDLRLTEFKDNISALSAWLLDMKQQPLLLDSFTVSSPGVSLPRAEDSFWEKVKHEVSAFFVSFFEDYSAVGFEAKSENITLWLNSGRDQAQVIKSMVSDMFTPQTGIGVDIKLVNATLVQARLSGNSPDVSIMQGRGQPVNLAARNALLPLDDFDGFKEVLARFQPSAATPYRLNGKTYALPDSQSFFMLFYRKDVLRELGLTPPETWDELREVSSALQRNNMEVGLPYTSIDASGAVDSGMGSRNIFSALLLQQGGRVYNDSLSATELSDPIAQQAFIDWAEFYQLYDMPLTYDFYNRFRTGEMPIGITSYTMYNQLTVAAPEIRGLWEMLPIPGTAGEDGTLDISQGGAGTAAIILRDTTHPEACWQFLKWWTSAEAQTRYSSDIEAAMGVSARYPTANIEAFQNIPWTRQETANLMKQWESVEEIPEAVGGYTLVRGLDNAFREAVLEGRNPREALLVWNRSINAEIHRKREEFRYDMD